MWKDIDLKFVMGVVIFGVGWGLVGICFGLVLVFLGLVLFDVCFGFSFW